MAKEEGCFRKQLEATPMCTSENLAKSLPAFLSLQIFSKIHFLEIRPLAIKYKQVKNSI